MRSEPVHLFVYGTLRKGFPGGMARWLARKGSCLGAGWCGGRLHDRGSYPVMTLADDPACRVRGDVYLLQRAAPLLARLDRYEGCSRAARPPGEYRRTSLDVILDDGRQLRCQVYLYRYPTRSLKPIPGNDYLRYRGL